MLLHLAPIQNAETAIEGHYSLAKGKKRHHLSVSAKSN